MNSGINEMAGINGWSRWAATWGVNLYGVLRCHRNNHKYGARKLRFPRMKDFFRKLFAVWAYAIPVLG